MSALLRRESPRIALPAEVGAKGSGDLDMVFRVAAVILYVLQQPEVRRALEIVLFGCDWFLKHSVGSFASRVD